MVTEIVDESEYFRDTRLQVSIFMSPLDVHVNRIPADGEITYTKYHPGKYLVAWNPKSSELNERFVTVVKTVSGEVLVKQIAGAVARRIVCYMQPGMRVSQGEELGFIKFGSRCDILLPPDSEVLVEIGQQVYGNLTPIARLPQ